MQAQIFAQLADARALGIPAGRGELGVIFVVS